MLVKDLQIGSVFQFADETKPRTVVEPRADVRSTVGMNGERVNIVHRVSFRQPCLTSFPCVHLSTDRGTVCVHEETPVTDWGTANA